jgi:hypothetical protein
MTDAASRRWRGQPGRLEVWYATATDAATGMGLWLHYELVAPTSAEAYAHGWVAAFPLDGQPSVVRFGPERVVPAESSWLGGSTFSIGPDRLTGDVDGASWDLAWSTEEPPLWTMGAGSWQREILPSSQVVLAPKARLRGRIQIADGDHSIDAIGNLAHIYGHGNAQRWGWLHADLDDTTTLEIVAAVGRRPGLRQLPPLSFVQLRHNGKDWPRTPLLAAPLFRAKLGATEWSVRGVIGTHRLTVTVSQPAGRCVHLDYTDPDGAGATCANTEIADVAVRLEKWSGRWTLEHEWTLERRAHAERGDRG